MKNSQDLITKLAEGFSTQAKTTNQFWLVLAISSIIALIGKADTTNLIDLPFTLGKVQPSDFYTITLVLISIIIIVFSAAIAQTIRTRSLTQKAIDNLPEEEKYIGKIHIQDYFDSIVSPTYLRVAPISQYLLGKHQFFGYGKAKRSTRILATVFYVLLKLTTFVFLYILPLIAIKRCWLNIDNSDISNKIYIPGFYLISINVLAGICMMIMLFSEIRNIINVVNRIKE